MKRIILSAALSSSVLVATTYGQGTVNFANFSSNKVVRIDTGGNVANSPANGWKVALYWLPDQAGTPTTADFGTNVVRITTIGVPVAGQFSAGSVTVPLAQAGAVGWFQVRGWEAIYGTGQPGGPLNFATWEEAEANRTLLGGRANLTGESNPFRIDTGDPTVSPAGTPGNLAGMLSFALEPVPEPSVIALGVLGIGALLLLRRRQQ